MNAIHPNSVAAYWQGSLELFGKRTREIVGTYRAARGPLEDREVMIALGFVDPNKVRPRISDLVEAGIAVEVGNQRCPLSGKTVRLVKLATRETQRELEFVLPQLQTVATEIVAKRGAA